MALVRLTSVILRLELTPAAKILATGPNNAICFIIEQNIMLLACFRAWLCFVPNIPTVLLALVKSSFQQQELLRTMHTEHLAALSALQVLVRSLAQETHSLRETTSDTQGQHTAILHEVRDTQEQFATALSVRDTSFRQYLEEMDSELRYLQKTIRTMGKDVHTTSAVLHTMEETVRTLRLV
jgi:branched-subunit amino acid transport protein